MPRSSPFFLIGSGAIYLLPSHAVTPAYSSPQCFACTWEPAGKGRSAPLAAGQPEFRRLADEIIFNRTSDPVILSRKYGDGTPGMFPMLPVPYVTCVPHVTKALCKLTAEFFATIPG